MGACVAGGDLQPFRLSWYGADPNITSLAGWQGPIAPDAPWIAVSPDGHYVLDGAPIRFLGVNVTAANAFPEQVRAEAHAARLARFGFNAVRFHHMEAPWDKQHVLIDYSTGTSRTLSAERLDRLHYFVAQLAQNGIYSDINLLVSREFQKGDGLGDEIAQMNWKDQHILGFFNDAALELHKEHARNLLTAPNPYRNLIPLAADPAVAFVEIMNENGLLQKWYEGVLDAMPEKYRLQLMAKWNEWLRARYESNAALLAGWGVIDQPLGPNLVFNGAFDAGTSNWNIERHQGAQAVVSTPADFEGQPALLVQVTTPGSANWHIQVNQGRIPLESGQVYTLTFYAKAESATPLSACIQEAHENWATLAPCLSATLTADWRKYTITFESTAADSNARVNFNGFGDRLAKVWIAQVAFQTGGRIGTLPEGASLEAGTVPNVPRAGAGATLAERRDWVRFAFDLEKRYWDEMRRYVKEDLGYQGIVWGTIISNSPPNAQSGMDAMDSHAYWQHPQFPAGQDWSPENWTVAEVSMVNSPLSSTLTGIARQRVQGRPHNVTEYQHSSPNTYSTEMPLLAAAYGALQDWDSIWFFEYPTGMDEFTTGFFDTGGNPGKMANSILAAALFRRGDAAPARQAYVMKFDPGAEVEAAVSKGGAWSIADGSKLGVPPALAMISRLALSIGPGADGLSVPPDAPAGPVYVSDTGELVWDVERAGQGIVTVNTARTKAVVGYSDNRRFDLGGVIIEPGATRQGWSTIGLAVRDGESLTGDGGSWGVIVTTGDHENTGQQWKSAARDSVGTRWGAAPALIEVIPAAITLPVPAWRVHVWALDENGNRMAELPVEDLEGAARFRLGATGPTLWYELFIAPQE